MIASSRNRSGVFISYSSKDRRSLEELQVHLKPLQREQDIDIWDDTRIRPGTKWREEIRLAVQQAKVAILLISPHFMASDFIMQRELPDILAAAEAEGVMVLQLILRVSDHFKRDERLTQFQTVNSPSHPLADMTPGKRDVVFQKLVETLVDILGRAGSNVSVAEPKRARITKPKRAKSSALESTVNTPRIGRDNKATQAAHSKKLIRSPRIYVSAPSGVLLNHHQRELKSEILRVISQAGFEPQEFGVSGLPTGMVWTFDRAKEVMSHCRGALILALIRLRASTEHGPLPLATEYNHIEGGIALSQGLPTFVVAEQGIPQRGIIHLGSGRPIVTLPENSDKSWLGSREFTEGFDRWCKSVRSSSQVFLGYSNTQRKAGNAIREYLKSLGVSVFDWSLDVAPGSDFKKEINKALTLSAASIFLFSRDDNLTDRGNLIFELGYLARDKGMERTLVICERGTHIPTDFAALETIIKDRLDIDAIRAHLRAFVHTML